MSGAGVFPFDPKKLAELAKLSRSLRTQAAPPPCATAFVNEAGYASMQIPGSEGVSTLAYVHAGLRLSWAPMPEQKGLLLTQWGGAWPEGNDRLDGVTAYMTRYDLRALIVQLEAIDAQLGDDL